VGVFGLEKMRQLSERICLSFVAGFLMIWEVEPVNKDKGWSNPRTVFAPAVALPKKDFRVRISKRELPIENRPS
jgi:hypothetical protein